MASAAHCYDTAAQWIARRGSEHWSAVEAAELERWLAASTAHRIAFLRLESLWRKADHLKVLGAGQPTGTVPSIEDWTRSPFFKHLPPSQPAHASGVREEGMRRSAGSGWRSLAVAAGILLLIATGYVGWDLRRGDRYTTAVGATAPVPLVDGSMITLNTGSEIRVAVTQNRRRVNLRHGEAFFQVAKDATRPFTVMAGNKRIIAVGTSFSVRRDADDIRIVVTEGRVRLEDVFSSLAVATEAERAPPGAARREQEVLLVAGSIASAHDNEVTVQSRPLQHLEELLSWREGYVVFHETALPDAIAEFNRYSDRKFLIEGGGLEDLYVSGNFRATNVESFARLLEQGFPVEVERRDASIILTRRLE